jgi:Zinc carboxypeptidase
LDRTVGRSRGLLGSIAVTLVVAATAAAISAPAVAQQAAPWDGNPISPGLGPTYGEAWCAPPSGAIAEQQDAPLALIPHEAIECTLEQFEDEAAAAGVPDRMEYEVIGQSIRGRDIFGVVVNALDTPQQQQAFANWQTLRGLMSTNPTQAQTQLASFGGNVKIPIFIAANIHGNEEEGADAMMQVIRDLVTLPYGANQTVDDLLDHAIVIVIPSVNPDGRTAGVRRNANDFDLNRDFLVQSQPEIRANVALQQEWLAPVGIDMHGYYSPTLIDGLTKPHNPGIEYDLFVKWNQPRLDANEAAFNNAGMEIMRPVNDWGASGWFSPKPVGPPYAEGWDDWGPFYTQTYMAFLGVDSSTLEMCDSDAGCDGRYGSKRAQYIGFYSSADFWVPNRQQILRDQLEIFRRGVTDAARGNCCDDPLVASRGFTEADHNWMREVPYPTAYVIPFVGSSSSAAQRSDAEANRMAQWLLDNGVEVHRATGEFSGGGQTFPAHSYVVWMDQALRGIALTTLSAGQDISERITQLYAPPGAWSHGLLWGADVVEIPRGASFTPATEEIAAVNPLQGGLRPGGAADWFAVTLQGTAEVRAVLNLLRDEVDGEIAEQSFTSTTGGSMPAGSVIFDAAAAPALQAAGQAAGMWFERGVGPKPATTLLDEAPRVAILVDTREPAENDTSWSLRQIFGDDVGFVSATTGKDSLNRAPADPLQGYDVIYNLGRGYPAAKFATARDRLQDFFQGGGGYIGTSVSSANFSFLGGAGLVQGSLTQGSDSADGGIARWNNVGSTGPLTGGFRGTDNLYLPANVTWFSSVPSGAIIDGKYLGSVDSMFVAGLWRDRNTAAAGAPMIAHGTTEVGSRYVGLATDPFSRGDGEREWPLIGQAALWSNLTDEP